MFQLSKRTPGENLLILNGENTVGTDVLKATLLDLIMKDVLKITDIKKQVSNRDKPRVYSYITTGSKYLTYEPAAHERVFLDPFSSKPSLRFLFRHLVKISFVNSKSESNLIKLISNAQQSKSLFKQGVLKLMFGPTINSAGEKVQYDLKLEMLKIEGKLNVSSTEEEIKTLIGELRGNLFLFKDSLRGLRGDWWFFDYIGRERRRDSADFADFAGFYDLDSYTESFDSFSGFGGGEFGGGGAGGSWDNGCSSGDSGCSSGCSGCGGGD